ncbi:hypothetical protein KIN20_012802 [Parelaphostrongylus tenuis]|uniref:Battenin n=1 Tax=Parelaphostrongylus tenuis TaxID=148309 RepID=A0AAD5QKI5_PARTN|nr:hypothetical protein KIN20_012802 [Parelaphostrongylus tenuis]
MLPLALVEVADFVINQGLYELITFDCEHGFGASPGSQYKWFQVLYQVGSFVAKSSIKLIQFNMTALIFLLPLLQFLNMVTFIFNAIYAFVPHFGVVCALVLYTKVSSVAQHM